jgi:hypothetical protein
MKMDWISGSWMSGFIMDEMDGMLDLLWMRWMEFWIYYGWDEILPPEWARVDAQFYT